MEFEVRTNAESRIIDTLRSSRVAIFSNDSAGQKAYAIFVTGIARTPGASLFDLDARQYVCGDVGQLDSVSQ